MFLTTYRVRLSDQCFEILVAQIRETFQTKAMNVNAGRERFNAVKERMPNSPA